MYKFKVGDIVHIINPYGIYLGKHKIIELDERVGTPTYYYENSDTPWYSVSESNIFNNAESALEAMWERLNFYRKNGEVKDV